MTAELLRAITQVTNWVESHNYAAYDPGDGEKSFLRHLTFHRHSLRRILTAVVLRSPFEIRPLIGIRPHISSKGMGYMGWGHTKMYAVTRDDSYRRRASFCFDWLMQNRSPGGPYYCWGNDFSFSTRAGTIPRYMPTIVWSSLIGFAFLDAYEVFRKERYLEVAASTAEWVKTLPREETSRGLCLSYIPSAQSSIHNSNMLGAALLALVARYTGDKEGAALARMAMTYSCARQNDNGAWYYGEAPKYHWIDNFHTGYNLDCLKRYEDCTGDGEFAANLTEGYRYFRNTFIEPDGRPRYYHNKVAPIDIQCAAQTVDTLAYFSPRDPEALELAGKTAAWTIANMQDRDGHFYYRDLGWKKIRTPMLHWGQGTMFKALAHLYARMSATTETAQDTGMACGKRDLK